MLERSLANNLAPNRDMGIAVMSEWFDRRFTMDGGIFNGVPDGGSIDNDTDNGKDFAFRIGGDVLAKKSPVKLRVAIAATRGTANGPVGVAYKTPAQQPFFAYAGTTVADGTRARISPQAILIWRSVTITSEYLSSKQELRRGTDSGTVTNAGWQATGRWLFNGVPSVSGKVAQKSDASLTRPMWEIVGRVSSLSVDDAAFPRFADPARAASGAKSIGAGVNFYPVSPLKLMLDFEHTTFDAAAGASAREDENLLGLRMQIVF